MNSVGVKNIGRDIKKERKKKNTKTDQCLVLDIGSRKTCSARLSVECYGYG